MNEKRSALIVDDDQMVLIVIGEMLSCLGYLSETAMSSRHALELLDANHFDVMITDVMMPGMGGLELIERVRLLRPGIGIIVVSGIVDGALRKKVLDAGASEFIGKPLSLERLRKAIQGLPAADRRGYESEGTGC